MEMTIRGGQEPTYCLSLSVCFPRKLEAGAMIWTAWVNHGAAKSAYIFGTNLALLDISSHRLLLFLRSTCFAPLSFLQPRRVRPRDARSIQYGRHSLRPHRFLFSWWPDWWIAGWVGGWVT